MRHEDFDVKLAISDLGLRFPEKSYGLRGSWPGLLDGATSTPMNGNFYRGVIFSGKFYRG